MPMQFNPATEEPYLRLLPPHSNIIITPHRLGQFEHEVTSRVEILNHPQVWPFLAGTPYPYPAEHAEEWVTTDYEEKRAVVEALRLGYLNQDSAGYDLSNPSFFDQCPFTCIREVLSEDPEGHPLQDNFIGDIALRRYSFYEHPPGSPQRTAAQAHNNALAPGDKEIVWGLGYFLSASHHGRGIMTSVLYSLIHDWGPRMNLSHLRAATFIGNEGSLKVFEKNNFTQTGILHDWVPVSESRGGGKRSIIMVRWQGAECKS
ncbi:hypothetical protein N7528_006585 [Penicillium herquei]|nr:hypothetical protein N7528_006585 [Penicillium herquei]